jgi:FkbM family methyltransferase
MGMNLVIGRAIDRVLRPRGYCLARTGECHAGVDLIVDAIRLLDGRDAAFTVFDVGANLGQSISHIQKTFSGQTTIHAFEPSPETFKKLSASFGGTDGVHLWNIGLGSSNQAGTLNECPKAPWINSFLPLVTDQWGTFSRTSEVAIRTLDDFAAEHRIDRIDLLKIDTQGFDLEVLRGADRSLASTSLVLVELLFSELYAGQSNWLEICNLLSAHDFVTASVGEVHHGKRAAEYGDMLFAKRDLVSFG